MAIVVLEQYIVTGSKIYNLTARARNKEFTTVYTTVGAVPITAYDIVGNAVVFKDAPTEDFKVEITDAAASGFIPSVTYDIVGKANVDLGNVTEIPVWIKEEFFEVYAIAAAELTIVSEAAGDIEIVEDNIQSVIDVAAALNSGGGIDNGGQYLGNGLFKGVEYFAQDSLANDVIIVTSGTNAMSVESFTLKSGSSLTIENDSTYKIL